MAKWCVKLFCDLIEAKSRWVSERESSLIGHGENSPTIFPVRHAMQTKFAAGLCLAILAVTPIRAEDLVQPRAVIDKAIQEMGGAAQLGKFKAISSKMKGDLHIQGVKVPFTGEVTTQGADQQKSFVELVIDGQKIAVVQVLNRNQGWVKINETTMDMTKDKLEETVEAAHAGWVASLVPLMNKAFKLDTIGESQVEGKAAIGIHVSYPGRRDVNLFFDKTTHLLVKTETRAKDEQTGQEVTDETFMSGYEGKEVKQALKLLIKRDGKPLLEAELSDIRPDEKLDDSVFAKP
ncbi:MAG: hypothetical protein HZA46_01210 [Planctomycetales bacterium]|nr:hypothetical protein [Planctomycetales bacterium]